MAPSNMVVVSRKGKTMCLYKLNENKLSYKYPLIQLSTVVLGGVLVLKRSTIFTWLGVSNQWMSTYGRLVDFLCFCFLWALVLPFYLGVIGIIETFVKRLELKRKQKMLNKRARKTGKQYSLDDIAKRLREEDIIAFEVKTLTGVITMGASSDCEPGSFKFFDKAYYIEDEEFAIEQEKEFLEKLSYMCGGESITVLSIDGVKVK